MFVGLRQAVHLAYSRPPVSFRGEAPAQPEPPYGDVYARSWFQTQRMEFHTSYGPLNRSEVASLSTNEERDFRIYIPCIMTRMNHPAVVSRLKKAAENLQVGERRDMTPDFFDKKPYKTTYFLEKDAANTYHFIYHYDITTWFITQLDIPFRFSDEGLQFLQEDLMVVGSNRMAFSGDNNNVHTTAYLEAYLNPPPEKGVAAGELANAGLCSLKPALNEGARLVYQLAGEFKTLIDSASTPQTDPH